MYEPRVNGSIRLREDFANKLPDEHGRASNRATEPDDVIIAQREIDRYAISGTHGMSKLGRLEMSRQRLVPEIRFHGAQGFAQQKRSRDDWITGKVPPRGGMIRGKGHLDCRQR